MDHDKLSELRSTYQREHILLCFNGPFSQGLIEEIGSALKSYLHSDSAPSSALGDVFACYIEITQNIRNYAAAHGYDEATASATVVIGRDSDRRYVILAGNVVEADDAVQLEQRIATLAGADKPRLKALYKEQMRRERPAGVTGAGLGLIDLARKASEPLSCSIRPADTEGRRFFSLRVVI